MHLLIVFLTALIIASVGFIMYVYFFSVGYGFSIAGIGIVLLIMLRANITPATLIMCLLFIIYGARLGGYLLYRELKSTAYKKLLKGESKSNLPIGVKICIWLACALLYLCETAPVLFRMEAGAGADVFSIIGIILMASGIIIEMLADAQKNAAKKRDPHMFVDTGLYSIVRCPNYFGELLLWTGVFISGLNIYSSVLMWVIALLGYIGIIYVMFSGARRLELRQDRNYGHNPRYQKYVKTVPIIIPFVPIYSVKKHSWLVA